MLFQGSHCAPYPLGQGSAFPFTSLRCAGHGFSLSPALSFEDEAMNRADESKSNTFMLSLSKISANASNLRNLR